MKTVEEVEVDEMGEDKMGVDEMESRESGYKPLVQSLFFLNTKFQALSHRLWLHSPVVSYLVGNPEDRFSHVAAHM